MARVPSGSCLTHDRLDFQCRFNRFGAPLPCLPGDRTGTRGDSPGPPVDLAHLRPDSLEVRGKRICCRGDSVSSRPILVDPGRDLLGSDADTVGFCLNSVDPGGSVADRRPASVARPHGALDLRDAPVDLRPLRLTSALTRFTSATFPADPSLHPSDDSAGEHDVRLDEAWLVATNEPVRQSSATFGSVVAPRQPLGSRVFSCSAVVQDTDQMCSRISAAVGCKALAVPVLAASAYLDTPADTRETLIAPRIGSASNALARLALGHREVVGVMGQASAPAPTVRDDTPTAILGTVTSVRRTPVPLAVDRVFRPGRACPRIPVVARSLIDAAALTGIAADLLQSSIGGGTHDTAALPAIRVGGDVVESRPGIAVGALRVRPWPDSIDRGGIHRAVVRRRPAEVTSPVLAVFASEYPEEGGEKAHGAHTAAHDGTEYTTSGSSRRGRLRSAPCAP